VRNFLTLQIELFLIIPYCRARRAFYEANEIGWCSRPKDWWNYRMSRGRHLVLRGETFSQHPRSFDQTTQLFFATIPLSQLQLIGHHRSLKGSVIDDTDSRLPHQNQNSDQRERENKIITSGPLGIHNQGSYEGISNKGRKFHNNDRYRKRRP
jgi:hypothetical protein